MYTSDTGATDTGGSKEEPALPLKGLRVIDLSRFLPAGFCSMTLGDFGAEVIRIEQPSEVAKQNKIFGRDGFTPEQHRRCKEQEMLVRNKRSVFLNLRDEGGRAALHRMLKHCDIFIHDYRLPNIEAMGFSYSALQNAYPRMIYCGVSLCGIDGPYRDLAGHDPIALALSGALTRFGSELEPHIPGLPVGDLANGMQAVIGILMALRERDKSNLGQLVDVAMSDGALTLMSSVMQRFLIDQRPPPLEWRGGNVGLWKTKDGKTLCTTDLEPAYWERFCHALQRPDLIPLQFDSQQAEYRDHELQHIFASRTRDEWFDLLRAAGTQVAPVYSLREALDDPHARQRQTVFELVGESGEASVQIAPGPKLSRSPGKIQHLGRLPGEDTEAVLREMGFSEEEIAELALSKT